MQSPGRGREKSSTGKLNNFPENGSDRRAESGESKISECGLRNYWKHNGMKGLSNPNSEIRIPKFYWVSVS